MEPALLISRRMKSAYPTTKQLRVLLALSEKRDRLIKELAVAEKALAAAKKAQKKIEPVTAVKRGRKPKAAPTPQQTVLSQGKRGAVKERILGLLKEAGANGLPVTDIAEKLGMKNANVHVWFNLTGKKIKGLKKVGRGIWAYTG